MGYGSYTAGDWARLRSSRGLDSASNANQIFTSSSIQDKYNSRFINIRESFDSEDSPNSTPIMLGFDVTGSMGYLAKEIATNSLNETIMQILTKKPVSNPHMMCIAITNPDDPIQATQYEADIRVVEQLLDFKLGGWNTYGYDNLLWYFAAKHTKIDSYEKRGKKGIIIGIGDEVVGADKNVLTQAGIKKCFDDDVKSDISFKKALEMASEKYEVVHIVVGDKYRMDGNSSSGRESSYSGWCEALPGRVARVEDVHIDCLAEVIVAILMMLNGADKETALEGLDKDTRAVVEYGIADFNAADNAPEKTLTEQFIEKKAVEKAAMANASVPAAEKTKKKGFLHGLFGNRK